MQVGRWESTVTTLEENLMQATSQQGGLDEQVCIEYGVMCTAVHDLAADQLRLHWIAVGHPAWLPHVLSLRSLTHSAGPTWQQRLDGQQQQRCPGVRCDTPAPVSSLNSLSVPSAYPQKTSWCRPHDRLEMLGLKSPLHGLHLCLIAYFGNLPTLWHNTPPRMHGSMQILRPCLQNFAAQVTECTLPCAGPSSSPTTQGLGLADNNTGSSHIFHLLDFSPEWDFTAGGVKMLVTGTLGANSDSFERSMHIMFDQQEVGPYALRR